jgi:hypothetical protein
MKLEVAVVRKPFVARDTVLGNSLLVELGRNAVGYQSSATPRFPSLQVRRVLRP